MVQSSRLVCSLTLRHSTLPIGFWLLPFPVTHTYSGHTQQLGNISARSSSLTPICAGSRASRNPLFRLSVSLISCWPASWSARELGAKFRTLSTIRGRRRAVRNCFNQSAGKKSVRRRKGTVAEGADILYDTARHLLISTWQRTVGERGEQMKL